MTKPQWLGFQSGPSPSASSHVQLKVRHELGRVSYASQPRPRRKWVHHLPADFSSSRTPINLQHRPQSPQLFTVPLASFASRSHSENRSQREPCHDPADPRFGPAGPPPGRTRTTGGATEADAARASLAYSAAASAAARGQALLVTSASAVCCIGSTMTETTVLFVTCCQVTSRLFWRQISAGIFTISVVPSS